MGAMKAITACHIALETILLKPEFLWMMSLNPCGETALDMNSKYKETSEGGLAVAVNVAEC